MVTQPPTRRDPLQGLTPADFVHRGNWPTGRLVTPEQLKDSWLTPTQRQNHVLGVGFLKQLALDYARFRGIHNLSNEQVAEDTGIGLGAIRDLREGRRFPSGRTLQTLRAYIATQDEMNETDSPS